jgi:hypothetical protein
MDDMGILYLDSHIQSCISFVGSMVLDMEILILEDTLD